MLNKLKMIATVMLFLLCLSGCRRESNSEESVIELTVADKQSAQATDLALSIKNAAWGQTVSLPDYISEISGEDLTSAASEFLMRFIAQDKGIRQVEGLSVLYGMENELIRFEKTSGTLAADILYIGSSEGSANIFIENESGEKIWESGKLEKSRELFCKFDKLENGRYRLCWESELVIESEADIEKAPYIMINLLSIPQGYEEMFTEGIEIK